MCTQIDTTNTDRATTVALLRAVPVRKAGTTTRRQWTLPAPLAAAIYLLRAPNLAVAMLDLSNETGINVETLRFFAKGYNASGLPWFELRDALVAAGVRRLGGPPLPAPPPPVSVAPEPAPSPTAPTSSHTRGVFPTVAPENKGLSLQQIADARARAAVTAHDAPRPVIVTPFPGVDLTPAKGATVPVTTSKGEVMLVKAPAALTTPSAAVGTPSAYATKTTTRTVTTDAATGDFIVKTVQRLVYGSPEHRAMTQQQANTKT